MKIFWLIILLNTVAFCSNAQFVHPGMLHNKEELESLKTKVNLKTQPCDSLWKDLCASQEVSKK